VSDVHPIALRCRVQRLRLRHGVRAFASFMQRPTRLLPSVLCAGALLVAAAGVPRNDVATVVADTLDGTTTNVQAGNTCPLDLERWGPVRGAEPVRDGGVYRQARNGTTNPSFYLPQQVVSGGQQWRFGFDTTVQAGSGGARVRIEVDWYSTPGGDTSGFIGHVDGPWVDVPVNATEAAGIRQSFTAPDGAVRANVLTDMRADDPNNTWTGRNCDYRRVDGQQPTTTATSRPAPTTTTTGPPPPPPLPPLPVSGAPSAGQDTAAGRHGWGQPIPEGSDEFDYGSEERPTAPDRTKWERAGSGGRCWPGYGGSGRRCETNTRVVGGVLRIVGEANGDTGWIASKFGQRYGRWEARVRSRSEGPDNGRQYNPLLILWPDSDEHPRDGEYDYLENGEPGARCAEAFIHYPHDDTAPVQQEFAQRCGVDLTQWHNFAIEWTPDHITGFLDGEQWFSLSGGESAVRRCVQCASAMHQTIQLDNFYGAPMQPAVYEVDWARVYVL
jgi:hypothetical protein